MPDTAHNPGSLGDIHAQPVSGSAGTPSLIQKTPGVCGGSACIRMTRITVWGLVEWKKLGLSDARILESVVGLTPADLRAAWDYYASHQAEIDEDIRRNEEA